VDHRPSLIVSRGRDSYMSAVIHFVDSGGMANAESVLRHALMNMKLLVLRCWWLALVVIGGCFSPQFKDGEIQCGPNDECPPGL
jgi:hypothetical protein